ncbi:CGNR zinc finger domain-containing protein [soil metagenome]
MHEDATLSRRDGGRAGEPLPDLGAFLTDHGADPGPVRPADVEAVVQLADRLFGVFVASDTSAAVAEVNRLLADGQALPWISGHDDSDWHLHFGPARPSPVGWLTVTAAMGLAAVLCGDDSSRLGACSAHACRDVYVDTSRNARRRYCSTGCANRANVAAFRARRRSSEEGGTATLGV